MYVDKYNPSYYRTEAHPGALKAEADVLGVSFGYAVSPLPTHSMSRHENT